MSRAAAVVIGRNEGARLERCLRTLGPQVDVLVYVDSGSKDGSVALAQSMNAHVVELDLTQPFTAARARNAGFEALRGQADIDLIQFIDGDCGVEAAWVSAAEAAMEADPKLGLVTGWRYELYPDNSIYNDLCDLEWRRPAGPITACGGDMMVRRSAFEDAGGFDPTVIAAEDDEFCQRIAQAGWHLRRLPEEMTAHDADMLSFWQWWKRAERTGHGFAQVGDLHPGYFRKERIRAIVFGVSYVRTVIGLVRQGVDSERAMWLSSLLTLSKLPNAIGMARYYWRKRNGRDMRIIEYK